MYRDSLMQAERFAMARYGGTSDGGTLDISSYSYTVDSVTESLVRDPLGISSARDITRISAAITSPRLAAEPSSLLRGIRGC